MGVSPRISTVRADRADGADGLLRSARQAKLPITDRIFTRIGASDNLARGRSTFLVEMSESRRYLESRHSRESGAA